MSPYRLAFDAWHSQGPPAMSWNDLLTWFLHHGALVSTADAFLLARPLRHDLPAAAHLSLSPLQYDGPADCWNIWLAAGNLRHLLHCSIIHPLPFVSYVRRGKTTVRIRRLDELAQNAAAAPFAAAARHRQGP